MEASLWIFFVFLIYFAILIGIAILRARHMDGMTDYVLAGRKLGSVTSALSSASSATSGWTMLVLPALAFAAGMMHLWTIVGIILGAWLAWTILAKRLRRYTIATGDSLTIPEFLEKRFNDTSGTLRALSGIITLYFMTLYVCSGLIAGAKLLDQVFDLQSPIAIAALHDVGVLITLIAIVSYTFIGGFLAVSRTDVFQALIMLTGFLIIPITLILTTTNPFQALESTAPGFWNPFTNAGGEVLGVMFFLSAAGWGLGALGSQRISARFMALERESLISRSRLIALIWLILIFGLALLMGLVSAPALAAHGVALPDAERLYIVVSSVFFHPIVAGLLLTAVIAAVMSTADSQLLLASAVASDDLPILRRITYSLSADMRVWIGRLLLITVGVFAAMISMISPDSIFALVSLAWGGMGAAFGPVVILALYWRRFNLWGALTAILSGAGVSTFWWLMGLRHDGLVGFTESLGFGATVNRLQEVGVWNLNPATPGFVLAMLLAIGVTLLTAPPSDEITDKFDEVNSPDWQDITPGKSALVPAAAD
ncbi:MAG: sodium/proline symporter [Chloroflexota bacterium]|nr:sodium/proline symporter [Chloroflexota bacterium]